MIKDESKLKEVKEWLASRGKKKVRQKTAVMFAGFDEYFQEGYSIAEIGKHFGISDITIRQDYLQLLAEYYGRPNTTNPSRTYYLDQDYRPNVRVEKKVMAEPAASVVESELDQLQQRKNALSDDYARQEENFAELQKQRSTKEDLLHTLEAELEQLNNECEAASREISILEDELQRVEKEINRRLIFNVFIYDTGELVIEPTPQNVEDGYKTLQLQLHREYSTTGIGENLSFKEFEIVAKMIMLLKGINPERVTLTTDNKSLDNFFFFLKKEKNM